MNLYSGRIGVVDLDKKETREEALGDEFIREHIGGAPASLALYNQYKESKPIIFGTGPFTGTLVPGGSLGIITAKSPQTGQISHAPFVMYGGAEMKLAGFDFLVVLGRSDEPVYLWVHDEMVEIKEGASIWGKDTWETTDALRGQHGDPLIQVLAIGMAGENRFNSSQVVLNYWGSGDRWGFASVLGEKKVKALALKGLGFLEMDDAGAFIESCSSLRKQIGGTDRPNKQGCIAFSPHMGTGDLIPWMGHLIHRYSSCFSCTYPCNTFVKYNEDPKTLVVTDVKEPGFLITDLSGLLGFKKGGFSAEESAQGLELSARVGIDPTVVSKRMEGFGRKTFKELRGSLEEMAAAQDDTTPLLPWPIQGDECRLEQEASVFSVWPPPRPVFGSFPLSLDAKGITDWWLARNSLAYTFGICPIFIQMNPEMNEEILLDLLKLGSGMDLTTDELHGVVSRLMLH
jgi:aldehyde:ferredoxin oxidoreductase